MRHSPRAPARRRDAWLGVAALALAPGLAAAPCRAAPAIATRPSLVSTLPVPWAGPFDAYAFQDLDFAIARGGTVHLLWSGEAPESSDSSNSRARGTFYQRGDTSGTGWTRPRRISDRGSGVRIVLLGRELHALVGPGEYPDAAIRHFASADGGDTWVELPPLLAFRWNMVMGFDVIAVGDTLLVASVSARRFPRDEYLDYPHPHGLSLNLLRWTRAAGRDSVHVAWFAETVFSQPAPAIRREGGRLEIALATSRNRTTDPHWINLFSEIHYFESEDDGRTWSSAGPLQTTDSLTVGAICLLAVGERRAVLAHTLGLDAYASADGKSWEHSRPASAYRFEPRGRALAASAGSEGDLLVWARDPAGGISFSRPSGSEVVAQGIALRADTSSVVLSDSVLTLGHSSIEGPSVVARAFGGDQFVVWPGACEPGSGAVPGRVMARLFLSRIRLAPGAQP